MPPVDPDLAEPGRNTLQRAAHLRPALVAWVALGGVCGTAARIAVTGAVPRPDGLPLATVAVNLLGALALGILLEALARRGPDRGGRRVARLLLGTGFCGGFTTYSTFTVDADVLLREGRPAAALGYLTVSLLGGLLATWAGIRAGRHLSPGTRGGPASARRSRRAT